MAILFGVVQLLMIKNAAHRMLLVIVGYLSFYSAMNTSIIFKHVPKKTPVMPLTPKSYNEGGGLQPGFSLSVVQVENEQRFPNRQC